MEDKLLTFKEAAEKLRTSEAGLRWMVHSGKAPKSALIGGARRMFRESDVQAFIDAAFADTAEV
ncbi:helix-turn-helix domain-containing protein [uncultured Microbacterium sp.]|uniref:helix-turn-helix transcriptional regulator n=1 Tax=uncultured Microbacterium sp. TaxID=191216 RepID=UPI0025EAFD54|nr:helix-turn-helix domain-containing protein [uncultured Microbacterium sp.]